MRVARTFVIIKSVYNCTDGGVGMTAHNLEIIKDGPAILHTLAYAVFENFEAYAEVEAVLNE